MYKTFSVRNFRCFRNIKIAGLKRSNLITGANNVGKTALLEGVFLHAGAPNVSLVLSLAVMRGVEGYRLEFGKPVEPPWRTLFGMLDETQTVELSGEGSAKTAGSVRLRVVSHPAGRSLATAKAGPNSERLVVGTTGAVTTQERHQALELEYERHGDSDKVLFFVEGNEFKSEPAKVRDPTVPGRFLNARWRPNFKEDAEMFGQLELENHQDQLISILRLVEPRLKRLSTIMLGEQAMLHADIGLGRLVPVAYLGDGILRLTRLVLAILRTQNGVILVDEIENGLHYSLLKSLWSAVSKTVESANAQLFATTHSRECVISAHQAFSESLEYDFSLQRLERSRDGSIDAIAYNKESLEAAVSSGFEVR